MKKCNGEILIATNNEDFIGATINDYEIIALYYNQRGNPKSSDRITSNNRQDNSVLYKINMDILEFKEIYKTKKGEIIVGYNNNIVYIFNNYVLYKKDINTNEILDKITLIKK